MRIKYETKSSNTHAHIHTHTHTHTLKYTHTKKRGSISKTHCLKTVWTEQTERRFFIISGFRDKFLIACIKEPNITFFRKKSFLHTFCTLRSTLPFNKQ